MRDCKTMKGEAVPYALLKRRKGRGRPTREDKAKKVDLVTGYIARDPRGVMVFTKPPVLTPLGFFEGDLLCQPEGAAKFIRRYRKAAVPDRGKYLKAQLER